MRDLKHRLMDVLWIQDAGDFRMTERLKKMNGRILTILHEPDTVNGDRLPGVPQELMDIELHIIRS
ncbi:hypothetical protein D6779_10170 [Candidatus Parcubacteria bacterium]|nr:MAG: hypothetical protein D6779_10170 [Candidatus Parcubacteria bacterium]